MPEDVQAHTLYGMADEILSDKYPAYAAAEHLVIAHYPKIHASYNSSGKFLNHVAYFVFEYTTCWIEQVFHLCQNLIFRSNS